VIGNRPIGA